MRRYLIVVFFFLCRILFAQPDTFPLYINHTFNGLFNVNIGQNVDMKYHIGANSEYTYSFESTSLSISIIQNPENNSEALVSLNPVLWVLSVLGNNISPNRDEKLSCIGLPFVAYWFIFQDLANAKIEPHLSEKTRISIGWNTDYYLISKGLRISLCINAGPKYCVNNFKLGLYLNYHVFGLETTSYDKFSVRLDLAYVFDENSISEFITYCRSIRE